MPDPERQSQFFFCGIMQTVTHFTHLETPLCTLRLTSNGEAITGFQQAATQLTEYFAHQRTAFSLPLAAHGTEFQKLVPCRRVNHPAG